MSVPAWIRTATVDNFGQLVLQNSHRGLVVVDFWAPWAGPSQRQRQLLTQLAAEMEGRFLLVSVNTDQQQQLAQQYGVKSLPNCKLFRAGKVVETLYGVQIVADYRRAIESYLTAPTGQVQKAVLSLWPKQPDKALQLLAEAAMAEPDNLDLPQLLAKLLMQLGRYQDAHAVLSTLPTEAQADQRIRPLLAHLDFIVTAKAAPEQSVLASRIAADPEDWSAHYQLASQQLLADDPLAAIEHLMAIVRQAPKATAQKAHQGLLVLFDSCAQDDPRIQQARTELFRLAH